MRNGGDLIGAAVAALLWAATAAGSAPAAFAQAAEPAGWAVSVSPGKPVATRARLTANSDLTRLVLDLTEPVAVSVSTVSAPDRVIVDLPEVEFRISAAAGQSGRGLVKSFRYGLFRPKQSRIVIDTDGPARVLKAAVESGNRRTPQLVIELTPQAPGIIPAAVSAPAELGPDRIEEPPPEPRSRKGRPVIVIDPGHGGLDPGAVGAEGLLEKDIVMAVVRRLRALLANTGRYTVVLTRSKDMYVSLDQRLRISRRHEADLFLSLHADSVAEENLAHNVRGASIYTLSDRASDEQARRLAEKENAADVLAGLASTPADSQDEVRDILVDLLRRETSDFSASFSDLVTEALREHIPLARDPQRSAAFKVLKQTHSPSVLIELGYMSNPEDRKMLQSAEWQNRVAGAIVAAIDFYFARRAARAVNTP
ncbi:MAG: N-acetylmuramoyl-L-alanine amidase [Hyphomicrobiaceae bacterium]|nr:N-acetylmuramoyl-L-alanine amidase [Hyphomicrobiaceae bacterium]